MGNGNGEEGSGKGRQERRGRQGGEDGTGKTGSGRWEYGEWYRGRLGKGRMSLTKAENCLFDTAVVQHSMNESWNIILEAL